MDWIENGVFGANFQLKQRSYHNDGRLQGKNARKLTLKSPVVNKFLKLKIVKLLHIRQEPGAKVSVKVIVSKLLTYKDLLTICSVLEAIPLIKKNFAVLQTNTGAKSGL